jgi:hypothetical protein
VVAWLAATTVAVGLSSYAVRSVLRDTVFEPPQSTTVAALPAPEPLPPVPSDTVPPTISATSAPAPVASASASSATLATKPSPSPSPSRTAVVPDSTTPPPVTGGSGAGVKTFDVKGGRASFTFGPSTARLIQAVPKGGWAVQVYPGDRWIRVDFTSGGRTSSVFVTWNDHPPLPQTYEY